MICIIALVVFGILGIFSARYRAIAKEAADCVFRRITFRKCHTGLDKKLKNQITGRIARKHPKAGKFIYKYFEVFSWIFLLLLLLSLVQVVISAYNIAAYGNCNGPHSTELCVITKDIFPSSASNATCSNVTNTTSPSFNSLLNNSTLHANT